MSKKITWTFLHFSLSAVRVKYPPITKVCPICSKSFLTGKGSPKEKQYVREVVLIRILEPEKIMVIGKKSTRVKNLNIVLCASNTMIKNV